MRKVTFGVANSLDNRIAREDGSIDWLLWSDEVNALMETFWKTIDTILIGRKTFEEMARMDAPAIPGTRSYVFSRTMKTCSDPKVEIISGDAVEFVRKLKNHEGKDICVLGGGEFARSLFEADLIDEISVNIHPLMLGSGTPLFLEMDRQIDLELLECRTLQHDCVVLTYRIK